MLEKDKILKKQDSIMQLIKLLFYTLMVGIVLSMSKQKIISRLVFWPLFIFAACMFAMIPYVLFYLITFGQIDERNYFMHFGKTYSHHMEGYNFELIKHEFSLNVLFIILSIFSGFIVWKVVNLLELQMYNENKPISIVEKIVGPMFGILFLFYIFNLSGSNDHITFFNDIIEYYSRNPFYK
jgi:hypothetical protein